MQLWQKNNRYLYDWVYFDFSSNMWLKSAKMSTPNRIVFYQLTQAFGAPHPGSSLNPRARNAGATVHFGQLPFFFGWVNVLCLPFFLKSTPRFFKVRCVGGEERPKLQTHPQTVFLEHHSLTDRSHLLRVPHFAHTALWTWELRLTR